MIKRWPEQQPTVYPVVRGQIASIVISVTNLRMCESVLPLSSVGAACAPQPYGREFDAPKVLRALSMVNLNSRVEGWPDWGFVAAWLWSVPAFRRFDCLPANVGVDEPRVSKNETYFPISNPNSRARRRPIGTDMFYALCDLPLVAKPTAQLRASVQGQTWHRDPDRPSAMELVLWSFYFFFC